MKNIFSIDTTNNFRAISVGDSVKTKCGNSIIVNEVLHNSTLFPFAVVIGKEV